MKIIFFGVRGSIPSPGPYTKKYGGNTTSILIIFKDNSYLIIDAGSGIRNLGYYLIQNYKPPYKIKMLFTHTHWDHIMGLPFFIPIYIKDTEIELIGPKSFSDRSLKDLITGQMTYEYFPVNSDEVAATFLGKELKEGDYEFNNFKIKTKFLNHPIPTLGYKIFAENKVIVTCYDHEIYQPYHFGDEINPDDIIEKEYLKFKENKNIGEFIANSDLVIFDSQYTKKEYYSNYIGWGHSYYEWVLKEALYYDVKKFIFHHHEPSRTDQQLDYIYQWAEKQIEKSNNNIKFDIAIELKEYEV